MHIRSGALTQASVLFALVMREMATRFGRSAGGYVWAVLEPAGTVALLTAVFSQISQTPPLGSDFVLYFVTGYMAFHVYMDMSRFVSMAVKVNRPLLSFPRVTVVDAILARFLLQALTSVTVFAIIIAGAIAIGDQEASMRLPYIMASLGFALALGLAVGTLNCVLFSYSPTWERAFNIINRPMFLISGVFFNFEDLPRNVQDLIWWNPLIHVTALMREGFYAQYSPSFVSIAFLTTSCLAVLVLGLLLLRALRRSLKED